MDEAFGENVPVEQTRRRQVLRDVLVQTDSGGDAALFPLQLASYMPERPDEVRVGRVDNLTNPQAVPTAAVSALWRMAGPRRVLVSGFTGLASSTKYRITLIVE